MYKIAKQNTFFGDKLFFEIIIHVLCYMYFVLDGNLCRGFMVGGLVTCSHERNENVHFNKIISGNKTKENTL